MTLEAFQSGQLHWFKANWDKHTPDAQRILESLYHVHHELVADPDGCLLRGHCLVIPTSLNNQLVQLAHARHQGIVKTKNQLHTKVCREKDKGTQLTKEPGCVDCCRKQWFLLSGAVIYR